MATIKILLIQPFMISIDGFIAMILVPSPILQICFVLKKSDLKNIDMFWTKKSYLKNTDLFLTLEKIISIFVFRENQI